MTNGAENCCLLSVTSALINAQRPVAATGRPAAATQRTAVEPAPDISQYIEEFTSLSEATNVQQMPPPPKPQTSPQSSESMSPMMWVVETLISQLLRMRYCKKLRYDEVNMFALFFRRKML